MSSSMYDIVIVQLSGKIYFWALRQVSPYKVIATSQLIADKTAIEAEAYFIAGHFDLPVFIEER